MYCGYITDTAFYNRKKINEKDEQHPQLVMDKTIEKYFNKELVVNDQRDKRLLYNGLEVPGSISFCYDGNQHKDLDVLDRQDEEYIARFFQVLEHIYMNPNTDMEEIEQLIIADPKSNTIYVRGTIKFSKYNVEATLWALSEGTYQMQVVMPAYFEFDLMFPGHEVITVKAYTDRQSFLDTYPYSTITNIIFPCDATYLLQPENLNGNIDALIKSTEYSLDDISSSVEPDNHSGLLTYYTKYVTKNSYGASVQTMLPFGVLYQGATPSSLLIREHIRNDLIQLGIAPEYVWEQLLPNIFVLSQFFIVPIWDNVFQKLEGEIYPSVINHDKFKDIIGLVFPGLLTTFINQYQEILVYGYGQLFLTSIPDPLNKEELTIQSKHPTYQIHMAQEGVGYLNQTPETREFNQLLNQGMATAMGEIVSGAVATQVIDDMTWHSFTSSKTEYHILSRGSYEELFKI